MLSYAANHNRGAHFIDLKGHIDDTLIKMFDQLSNNNNGFFYGRYDIMCSSVEELKAGKILPYWSIMDVAPSPTIFTIPVIHLQALTVKS